MIARTRIVLFSGQDLAYSLVRRLASRGDLDLFVVTETTKRDAHYGYRSGADACRETQTAFVESARVDEALARRIAEFKPRLIVTGYYAHILPAHVIEAAELGGVNVHPGILPRYRGRFPTAWCILNGEKVYGIALHKLATTVDSGDVYVQRQFPLSPALTGHELYKETMERSQEVVCENLDAILSERIRAVPQSGFGSCYNFIERRFQINWDDSAITIHRRIRVHAKPYLPAQTHIFNYIVLINRATIVDPPPGITAEGGGRIVGFEGVAPIVTCADGCLRLDEYEFAPALDADGMARHICVGARFG